MIDLKSILTESVDEKYKQFHSSLCPGTNNIMGVRLPRLREIAKQVAKESPIEFLDRYKCQVYEEKMIYGLVIGYMKADLETRLKYLEQFVPMIDNWAICDTFCAGLKIAKKNQKIFWEFIQKYLYSENEYEVRFAVVMMLYHFLDDKHTIEVSKKLDTIKHEGYYVKVAVAWLISIMYIKYPGFTFTYLEECNLDDITFNKAIQKISESKRVSDEEKVYIRDLKRI